MSASQSMLEVLWSLSDGGKPLSTFQRVLLMTDGTVTDILEAYVAEEICVVKLAQSYGLVDGGLDGGGFDDSSDSPELELHEDEKVLHRSVLLQGRISGTNFIYGDSVIVPGRLPPAVFEGLLTTGKPIGRLLTENRIETFREIVGLRFEPAADLGRYFGVEPSSPLLFRAYRIYVGKRPVMRITERFPITWFGPDIDV